MDYLIKIFTIGLLLMAVIGSYSYFIRQEHKKAIDSGRLVKMSGMAESLIIDDFETGKSINRWFLVTGNNKNKYELIFTDQSKSESLVPRQKIEIEGLLDGNKIFVRKVI